MKALLLKDIFNLSKYGKTLLVLIVFESVIAFSVGNYGFLCGIVIAVFSILTFTTFSYDEQAKWDSFALTLPITKKEMVKEKYVLNLLVFAFAIVASITLGSVMGIVKNAFEWKEIWQVTMGGVAGLFVSMMILLPFIYRFGVEKGRIIMFAAFAIPFGAIMLLSKVSLPTIAPWLVQLFLYLSPLVLLFFYYLSYRISYQIFLKKEF